VKLYQKAAQQSDALALLRLGVCYQMGKGVDRDEFTATDFYQKASSQGHPIAMFNLAVCLLRGIGVKKNTAEGEFWMNMAANTGLPRAHNYLSSIRSSDASFRNLAISTLKENLEDFAELGYADAIDDLKKRDPS
jgi:TPR repeat protein